MSRQKAINLYKKFHGKAPPKNGVVRIGMKAPADALEIGELDGIMYRVKGHKKAFLHRFTKTRRPLLFVSSDGKQIFVLRGAFRFTERGFLR
jgi:hypothetical protein